MASVVDVARFGSLIDAQRALDLLAEAGIDADLLDVNLGVALGVPTIVPRLIVRSEDAERARALLRSPPASAGDGGSVGTADGTAGESADEETVDGHGKGPPRSVADVEAWARTTLVLALVGLVIVLFAIAVVFRVHQAPPEVEHVPRAARRVAVSRVLAWASILLWAVKLWTLGSRS